jgi:hypothetical protein
MLLSGRVLVATVCAVFMLLIPIRAGTTEHSFWVWNRADPLTSTERTALTNAGVHRLYWQCGEVEIQHGELVLRRTAAFPFPENAGADRDDTLRIIPVIRVSTSIRSPAQFSDEALGRLLRPLADAAPGRELQIDFDCPDRLLPLYAERLRAVRQLADVRRLTITALAGWAQAPAAAQLWPVVDAVYPMLYDTQVDPVPAPGDSLPCRPRPLLDPDELGRSLHAWQRCPIPWFAGLPVFARVTLYDAGGHSRGHLRSWDWDDLIFNAGLLLDRPPAGGTTVLRATRPTRLGENPVGAGDYAAVRTAPRAAIQAGVTQAEAAGARGVVFFRLPDPPSPLLPTGGGWSLAQVLALLAKEVAPGEGMPRLMLRRPTAGGERWVLQNDSDCDLAPRFDTTGRGYELELELADGAPGWREALAGDFRRVVGHRFSAGDEPGGPPEDKPVPVVIPLAQRLTFWFAGLPAHAELSTGLIQLAPGLDPAAVHFRVPRTATPSSLTWQPPR